MNASASSESKSQNKKSQSSFLSRLTNFADPNLSRILIISVGCLLVISLLMVASASIPFALASNESALYYFTRQASYILTGIIAGLIVYKIPIRFWYHDLVRHTLLVLTGVLLFVTVIFGNKVNGSTRWLNLGFINFQTAELAKLVMIIYTADFVVRRSNEVRVTGNGIFRIAFVVVTLVALLLAQPDFGSMVVIVGTVLAIFFVAGGPAYHFWTMGAIVVLSLITAVLMAQYRVARVTSFLDPFDDMQNTDYQLSRSLVAFARGEFSGVGYGESIQKLSHLPESHTDFVLAITGEELGFLGVLVVLLLEACIVACAMRVSYLCLVLRQTRMSYTAFGIAIIFVAQITINAGMNMGLLPTKGLTMPLFSFGGSSMVICLIMIAILLKMIKDSPTIENARSV